MRPRRRFAGLLLPVLAAALYGCSGGNSHVKPDVVIVLIDTLRADFIQPQGYDRETTPHLSLLADESVLFEAAHAPAPWTLPSVVSIHSGRHMAEHNVVTEKTKLSAEVPILSQILSGEGYRTASFHKNAFAGTKAGLDRGFDQCHLIRRNVDGVFLQPVYDEAEAEGYSSPMFLYIHNAEPHDPHHTRKKFLTSFDPVSDEFLEEYGKLVADYRSLTRIDYVKKKPLGTTDNTAQQESKMSALTSKVEEVNNLYACSVRDADDRVGSIIAEIKDRGRWDQTLFIVISDHGEEMSEHGGWQHDQSAYQELLHVPLIVKLPGGAHAGHRVLSPVSLVDLLPTILDTVGADLPENISGRSLLPLIESEPDPEPRLVGIRNNARKFYRPYKELRGDLNIAVRWGDWKGIFNVEPDTFELYDLAADPGESRDLSEERPEVTDKLRQFAAVRYAELLAVSVDAVADGGLDGANAEVLQSLKDLGYIGDDIEPEHSEDDG